MIHGFQHELSAMEKSHVDFAGEHCPKRFATQTMSAVTHMEAIIQRKVLWHLPVFNMCVSIATVASFGSANDMIPGPKPAIVQRMQLDFCWDVRVSMCFPMPARTPAKQNPAASQPHIWLG